MPKRKNKDTPYNTASIENYVVPDNKITLTEASLRNAMSHIYEKALQSVKTPMISWADAVAGAAASGLVTAVIKLCTPDLQTYWPDWIIPVAFASIAVILFVRRVYNRRKVLSNFDARDNAVTEAMQALRPPLPTNFAGENCNGEEIGGDENK